MSSLPYTETHVLTSLSLQDDFNLNYFVSNFTNCRIVENVLSSCVVRRLVAVTSKPCDHNVVCL